MTAAEPDEIVTEIRVGPSSGGEGAGSAGGGSAIVEMARRHGDFALADFLRDRLRLTGTHLGCEHGVCGACTVLADGAAIRSCLVFAVQMDGAAVTTVEGLTPDGGGLSDVQEAFRAEHGLQCGFCTPGFVVSVTAFLDANPEPSAEHTNTCGRCAYRGPWLFETVAREQMMDIVARAIGMDPLALRRANVITGADLPYTSATGVRYDRISPARTLEQAAELIGYDSFRREQQAAREQGRYLGVGLSLYVEPIQTRGPLGSEGAIVRIDPTGEVTLIMGPASHGQSLETTMAQVVADVLGCEPGSIVFIQGDTAVAPWGPGTGGSKSAVVAAGAARLAAEQMRDKLLRVAGHVLEVSASDLELSGGGARVRGDPEARVSFGQLAAGEVPDVEYGHVATPADTPGGFKGVGEGGAIGSQGGGAGRGRRAASWGPGARTTARSG